MNWHLQESTDPSEGPERVKRAYPVGSAPAGCPMAFGPRTQILSGSNFTGILSPSANNLTWPGLVTASISPKRMSPEVGREEAGDHLHGGGLAASRRFQQGGELSGFDLKVHLVHGRGDLVSKILVSPLIVTWVICCRYLLLRRCRRIGTWSSRAVPVSPAG